MNTKTGPIIMPIVFFGFHLYEENPQNCPSLVEKLVACDRHSNYNFTCA
jgi:hypothetical protein